MVSTESQVMALLEEGNPAIEVTETPWSETTAAAYLATLEHRSSEVTQLDTEQTEPTSPKRPLGPWLIAAAAAVILGVAIVLVTSNSETAPVATIPTPTTVVDAAPTTVAEVVVETTAPAPTTTIDAAEAAWDALPVWSGQAWGDVRVNSFEPALQFNVPDGFGRACLMTPTGFDMVPTSAFSGATELASSEEARLVVARLELGSVEETTTSLSAMAGSATVPQTTTIGGVEGLLIDATAPEGGTTIYLDEGGGCSLSWGHGAEWRFWSVGVAGQTVTFALHSVVGELDRFAEEIQPVLDSIIWKDLS